MCVCVCVCVCPCMCVCVLLVCELLRTCLEAELEAHQEGVLDLTEDAVLGVRALDLVALDEHVLGKDLHRIPATRV